MAWSEEGFQAISMAFATCTDMLVSLDIVVCFGCALCGIVRRGRGIDKRERLPGLPSSKPSPSLPWISSLRPSC